MTTLLETSNPFWAWLTRASWQTAVLVLLVLAVQWALRKQLTPRWRGALWWLVVIRLLLPFSLPSGVSLFNWIGWGAETRDQATPDRAQPPSPSVESFASATEAAELSAGRGTLLRNFDRIKQSEEQPELGESLALPHASSDGEHATLSWRMVLVCLWILGLATLAARVVWSGLRLQRELRLATPVRDTVTLSLLDRCGEDLRIHRLPALLETPAVFSPALCGLFHPRLLLPPGLIGRFTQGELRFIFLHELAHLKRRDIATNWLSTLLQLLHWFNPLVWLAFARMRADRELACDALVLAHAEANERRAYGQTIIKLLESFTRPSALPGLVGILEDKSQMKRRILTIVGYDRARRSSLVAMLVIAALAMVALTDARTNMTAGRSARESAPEADPQLIREINVGVVPMPSQNTSEPQPKGGLGPRTHPASHQPADDRRTAIQAKLREIQFDDFVLRSEPLPDFIKALSEEAQQHDPEGKGINFLLSAPSDGWPAGVLKIVRPARLQHVSLEEVLKAIVSSTDTPLKYSVEDYGVVLSRKYPEEYAGLEVRKFKLDFESFVRALHECRTNDGGGYFGYISGRASSSQFGNVLSPGKDYMTRTNLTPEMAQIEEFKGLLDAAGVDLSPPKALFLNDRLGVLMVRATPSDLDNIAKVLHALNAVPPQVRLEAKFVEVTGEDSGGREFLKSLGFKAATARPVPVNDALTNADVSAEANRTGTNAAVHPSLARAPMTSILTPPRFRTVLEKLEQHQGVDVLSTPRVTTLSGQDAQIKTVAMRHVVAGLQRPEKAGETPRLITQPMEFGPILDVIPHVAADGVTIQNGGGPDVPRVPGLRRSRKTFRGRDLEHHRLCAAQVPPAPSRDVGHSLGWANPRDRCERRGRTHKDERQSPSLVRRAIAGKPLLDHGHNAPHARHLRHADHRRSGGKFGACADGIAVP